MNTIVSFVRWFNFTLQFTSANLARRRCLLVKIDVTIMPSLVRLFVGTVHTTYTYLALRITSIMLSFEMKGINIDTIQKLNFRAQKWFFVVKNGSKILILLRYAASRILCKKLICLQPEISQHIYPHNFSLLLHEQRN